MYTYCYIFTNTFNYTYSKKAIKQGVRKQILGFFPPQYAYLQAHPAKWFQNFEILIFSLQKKNNK